MGADYREQYRPDQLEPFWPHEILKMAVAVLCTLAVIMFFAVLPALLEAAGLSGFQHHEEPANPHGATPVGIKPEWYFLAVYQYLRLMPQTFLGLTGKTLGVLSQGLLVLVIVLLPFWYHRRAAQRPGWRYRAGVTAVVVAFVGLTLWGGWPEDPQTGHEIPLAEYLRHQPMMFLLAAVAVTVFYTLIAHERRAIRRVLDGPPPVPDPAAPPAAAVPTTPMSVALTPPPPPGEPPDGPADGRADGPPARVAAVHATDEEAP